MEQDIGVVEVASSHREPARSPQVGFCRGMRVSPRVTERLVRGKRGPLR